MPKRPNNGGFTLLELTCALFVITVAGFGAIQLYSIGLDKMAEMREHDVALEVLRNELELLRAQPFAALADGMPPAAATPVLESLHEPALAVAVADGGAPGLKEVSVTLRWQSRHGRWIGRSLTTLIADKGVGGAA